MKKSVTKTRPGKGSLASVQEMLVVGLRYLPLLNNILQILAYFLTKGTYTYCRYKCL